MSPAATRIAPSRQPVRSCTSVAQSRCSAVIHPSLTRISPSFSLAFSSAFSVSGPTCIPAGSPESITSAYGGRKVDTSG